MSPHPKGAALLAAAALCLLAAAPASALNARPAPGDVPHAAHRPNDKVHPVQPPPGRLAQGGPVQRAAVPSTH